MSATYYNGDDTREFGHVPTRVPCDCCGTPLRLEPGDDPEDEHLCAACDDADDFNAADYFESLHDLGMDGDGE